VVVFLRSSHLQQERAENRGDKTTRSRSSECTLWGPVNFGRRGNKRRAIKGKYMNNNKKKSMPRMGKNKPLVHLLEI
jgi:hypothetical protein